jgi:hypothetical protein
VYPLVYSFVATLSLIPSVATTTVESVFLATNIYKLFDYVY